MINLSKSNKKGQGLSMNTIIIAILAILVLVVIAAFFTGGMTGLVDRIKGIYGSQPIDETQAILECEGFCNSYTSLPTVEEYKTNYCEKKFGLDTDNDGSADIEKTCSQLGIICQKISDAGGC
ncbi:hypothetical protein HN943_01590 [archaeon]|nr:hypothetical protein [archaeon]